MPELPEVETVCRQLKKEIAGKIIIKNKILDTKLVALKNLNGRKVINVERRGKTIVIRLDDDRSIFIHLRMTGRFLWQIGGEVPKYSRWKLTFEEGEVFLVDPRRFATVRISKNQDNSTTGREIFDDFDLEKFVEQHGKRKTKIKSLIMDQNTIKGIGNIYACEILHRAGIHPARETATMTIDDWKRILTQARAVLQNAIKKRGTSISDWRDLYGRKGEHQHELAVYGKEGSACPFCGAPIYRVKQAGRGTYFCKKCQK